MMTEPSVDSRQRRQARRLALLLGLLVVAIYAAFIFFSIARAPH
jgi:hypothetical protein